MKFKGSTQLGERSGYMQLNAQAPLCNSSQDNVLKDETQDVFPSFTAGGNETWQGGDKSLAQGFR